MLLLHPTKPVYSKHLSLPTTPTLPLDACPPRWVVRLQDHSGCVRLSEPIGACRPSCPLYNVCRGRVLVFPFLKSSSPATWPPSIPIYDVFGFCMRRYVAPLNTAIHKRTDGYKLRMHFEPMLSIVCMSISSPSHRQMFCTWLRVSLLHISRRSVFICVVFRSSIAPCPLGEYQINV